MSLAKTTILATATLSIVLFIIGFIYLFGLLNDEMGVLILNFALFFGTLASGMGLTKILELKKE